jgi:hypothetical protein
MSFRAKKMENHFFSVIDSEKPDRTRPKLIRLSFKNRGLCAVERRNLPVGANPTRQLSLQPEAIGAVVSRPTYRQLMAPGLNGAGLLRRFLPQESKPGKQELGRKRLGLALRCKRVT